MSSSDMFKVKLAEFQKNAGNFIQNLLEDENLNDVTLVSHDEQQIDAHRIVLGSTSGFFKRLFSKNSINRHPLVYLRGINYKELKAIVTYIYKGEVEIQKEDMESFFQAGLDLEVLGLKDMADFSQKPGELSMLHKKLNLEQKILEIKENNSADNIKEEPVKNYYKGSQLTCTICEKILINRKGLLKHKRRYHNTVLHSCSHCNQTFKMSEALHYHINLKHSILNTNNTQQTEGMIKEQVRSIVIQLECSTCGKTFLNRRLLQKHQRRVHNAMVHSCSHCYQTYKRSEHLKRHFDSIHGLALRHESNIFTTLEN